MFAGHPPAPQGRLAEPASTGGPRCCFPVTPRPGTPIRRLRRPGPEVSRFPGTVMSLRLVPPLPPGTPGDQGLTGPGSVMWRISRERVVPLGGLSALLLQLAHPLVAAGVAEHSSFHQDPVKRLKRTLELLLVTTFGDACQVGEMTRRIAGIHRVVSGSLQQDVGEWRRGTRYSATSPELCLWVYATIVETALNSYSTFVRPLDQNERAELYRESERFGQLCGVGKDIRPASYQDFQDYYARTLSRLTAGDQARSVARMILRARLRGIPVPPWGYLLAAGLLPAPLRAQYGLRWSAAQRALWWLFTHATHVVMCRLAPPRIRFWGHYHVAVVRCRPAHRSPLTTPGPLQRHASP
jgi:uncharacterized protein (DUF2236 family)